MNLMNVAMFIDISIPWTRLVAAAREEVIDRDHPGIAGARRDE